MKLTATVARYLLGLMFTVFGLNGFLNFIKQPPPSNPLAIEFLTSAFGSHFAYVFFAFQLIAGLLLISGYFVPLALTVLAGELINILAFHATMDPAGFAPGILALVLWIIVFVYYRPSFEPLLQPKAVTI